MSPIGQNIVIMKTNRFSGEKTDYYWQSFGQHNSLYYQPQPDIHNHRQQYCHDRIIQQASSKNDYDREKGVAHSMISSGIPTPEKHKTSIIPLENYSYSRKKTPTDSY